MVESVWPPKAPKCTSRYLLSSLKTTVGAQAPDIHQSHHPIERVTDRSTVSWRPDPIPTSTLCFTLHDILHTRGTGRSLPPMCIVARVHWVSINPLRPVQFLGFHGISRVCWGTFFLNQPPGPDLDFDHRHLPAAPGAAAGGGALYTLLLPPAWSGQCYGNEMLVHCCLLGTA